MLRSLVSRASTVAAMACILGIGLADAAQSQIMSPQPTPPADPSSTGPAASPQTSPATEAVIEVQAFDLGFRPASIELAAGTTRIVLHNTGAVPHNLTVDALQIRVVAARGLSSETSVTDPPPGTYEFYCSISGHEEAGMVGTLVVQESAPVEPTGAPSPAVSRGATASG